MSFTEAEEQIEQRALSCLPTLHPTEARSVIARHFDAESERIYKAMENLEITAEVYRECWFHLIESYKKHQFHQRLERQLKKLQSS